MRETTSARQLFREIRREMRRQTGSADVFAAVAAEVGQTVKEIQVEAARRLDTNPR